MSENTLEDYQNFVNSWHVMDEFNGVQIGMPVNHDTSVYRQKLQDNPRGALSCLHSMDMEDIYEDDETGLSHTVFSLVFKVPFGVMMDLSMGLFVYNRVNVTRIEVDGVIITASGQASCNIESNWCQDEELSDLYADENVLGCGFLRNSVLGADQVVETKDELNDFFLNHDHYCADGNYSYAVVVQDVVSGSFIDSGVSADMFDSRFLLEASSKDISKALGVYYDPEDEPSVIVQDIQSSNGRKWRVIGHDVS